MLKKADQRRNTHISNLTLLLFSTQKVGSTLGVKGKEFVPLKINNRYFHVDRNWKTSIQVFRKWEWIHFQKKQECRKCSLLKGVFYKMSLLSWGVNSGILWAGEKKLFPLQRAENLSRASTLLKNTFMQMFLRILSGMVNGADTDQTASSGVFAYAICLKFGVWNFRIFTVI